MGGGRRGKVGGLEGSPQALAVCQECRQCRGPASSLTHWVLGGVSCQWGLPRSLCSLSRSLHFLRDTSHSSQHLLEQFQKPTRHQTTLLPHPPSTRPSAVCAAHEGVASPLLDPPSPGPSHCSQPRALTLKPLGCQSASPPPPPTHALTLEHTDVHLNVPRTTPPSSPPLQLLSTHSLVGAPAWALSGQVRGPGRGSLPAESQGRLPPCGGQAGRGLHPVGRRSQVRGRQGGSGARLGGQGQGLCTGLGLSSETSGGHRRPVGRWRTSAAWRGLDGSPVGKEGRLRGQEVGGGLHSRCAPSE